MSRAGTFGRWVFFYERFIGSVLRDLKSPSFESIELALTIAERRRARALLDQLDAAGGTERVAQRHPSSAPRTELLLQASDLQRQLAASSLTATERSSLRQALDKTEVRAAALAREIAATDAAFSSLRLPAIPRLSQLQGALATDEALLVYLVPETLQYGSRPRVFVITRSTARVETLALESIEQRVELFEHLLQRRDNSDIPAAQRLYRELLAVLQLFRTTRQILFRFEIEKGPKVAEISVAMPDGSKKTQEIWNDTVIGFNKFGKEVVRVTVEEPTFERPANLPANSI